MMTGENFTRSAIGLCRAVAVALAVIASQQAATAVHAATVPAPSEVLGYPLGSWITDYHGMEEYLSILAEASPRVLFASYGNDDEKRQLRYAVVSSAANIERLDGIREATARLTDPRSLAAAEAEKIVEETPVIIWLNYSTDGNETAGLESALMMAHYLAADESDEVARLLDRAVMVITPMMNPSSHERWASWSNSFAAGPAGNADPLAMEHNPPWGVLTNNNHFLVDLNRESIWATQRESAALRDLFYQWNPAVFIDHHGEYDNFTGPGYEEPLNPLITERQRSWLDRFGRAIGSRFGSRGWSYSPWETGSFYPGFWESFGSLNGAIGFTYETMGGGSRGLRFERQDGSIATLEDAARQHFEASLAVIETSVGGREELLRDYLEYWRTASRVAAEAPEKGFIVDPRRDPRLADELVGILIANRVEVYRATSDFEVRSAHDFLGSGSEVRTFPAGAFWIPVDQPRARLLITMMRRDFRLPEVTLAKAETFRANSERAGFENPMVASTGYLFYDVTAWSLPLTYNVPAYWAGQRPAVEVQRVQSVEPSEEPVSLAEARFGYLFSGEGLAGSEMFIDLLQQDVILNVAYDDFTIAGREFRRGAVLARGDRNSAVDLRSLLEDASRRYGVEVIATDDTYSETGPSMGSDRMVYVRRPKIAVLAGDPVSTRSFGDLWFTLERLYRLEFTAVYREQLSAETLGSYDVLILPHGYYTPSSFPLGWVESLKGWIARGGTLICLGRASSWAADPELALSSLRMRQRSWPPATDDSEPEGRETRRIPGAILRALPDPHHYLTFGYAEDTPVLVFSNLAFEPSPSIASPFRFAALDKLRLAGFAYEDSLQRLAGTPYLMDERVGQGHIVLFLDDPNFRVYWRGLSRLFLNSVLLSPSF